MVRFATLPLILRVDDFFEIVRFTISLLSSSSKITPLLIKIFLALLSNSKTPSITVLSANLPTISLSALFPKSKFIDSRIRDLPEPVSPVKTLNPSSKNM